jgi:chromosome segregation ATPase
MKKWFPSAPVALAFVVALTPAAPASAQDEGVKQTEQLVKKCGATVSTIAETKLQLKKTMDVYNSLLADDASDLKGLYKKLQKEMDATEKKRAEIPTRANEMNVEAKALFDGWAASTAAIESPDLRQRSEERLEQAKTRYAEIGTVGKKAADLYEPVMKALRDQVTYLGHDLNASAVASLKPDAAKLNAQVDELNKSIDDTITTANTNIGALRP